MDKPEVLFQICFKLDRHSSKKNEKVARHRGKKLFIGKSDKAILAENKMMQGLIRWRSTSAKTITEDVNAQFIFTFPHKVFYTKDGHRSKKLPDLSNLYELPQDCLQKCRIIENDTQICSHNGSQRRAGTNEFWIEIILTRINA